MRAKHLAEAFCAQTLPRERFAISRLFSFFLTQMTRFSFFAPRCLPVTPRPRDEPSIDARQIRNPSLVVRVLTAFQRGVLCSQSWAGCRFYRDGRTTLRLVRRTILFSFGCGIVDPSQDAPVIY